MIHLEDYKKALGELTEQLSEQQILKLRDQHDQMAELFFNLWFTEINQKKV
jgi:hypothetical protein